MASSTGWPIVVAQVIPGQVYVPLSYPAVGMEEKDGAPVSSSANGPANSGSKSGSSQCRPFTFVRKAKPRAGQSPCPDLCSSSSAAAGISCSGRLPMPPKRDGKLRHGLARNVIVGAHETRARPRCRGRCRGCTAPARPRGSGRRCRYDPCRGSDLLKRLHWKRSSLTPLRVHGHGAGRARPSGSGPSRSEPPYDLPILRRQFDRTSDPRRVGGRGRRWSFFIF